VRTMLTLGPFTKPARSTAQVGRFAIFGARFFAVLLYTTSLQEILGLSAVEGGLVYMPGTVIRASWRGERQLPRKILPALMSQAAWHWWQPAC